MVQEFGEVDASGINVNSTDAFARPAFNLNTNSILFRSSASASGKSAATVGGALVSAAAPSGSIKFTFQSTEQTFKLTATAAESIQSGASLSFRSFVSSGGSGVSCYLANGNNAYYGKLTTSAGGKLSIPLSGVVDGVYTLKVFTEQANADTQSDFCSAPVTMTVTVSGGVGTVSNFSGEIACSAVATPQRADYDQHSATAGVTFTLDPGEFTLVNLIGDGDVLTEGKDYIRNGNEYTISQDWLNKEDPQDIGFMFDMSGGNDPVMTINIFNSSAIQLGMPGAGNTIYFGDYLSGGTSYRIPWITMGHNHTLQSKYLLGTAAFRSENGYYSGSSLQSAMKAIYDGFDSREQAAIGDTSIDGISTYGGEEMLPGQKLFPLSLADVTDSSYSDAMKKAVPITSPDGDPQS